MHVKVKIIQLILYMYRALTTQTVHFKRQTAVLKFGLKLFADSMTEKIKKVSQTLKRYGILSIFFLPPNSYYIIGQEKTWKW